MDPFTWGIVSTGVFGSSLVVLGLMGKVVPINEDAIKIVLEFIKFGAFLYLLKVLYIAFIL